jgi:hypothetical protein
MDPNFEGSFLLFFFLDRMSQGKRQQCSVGFKINESLLLLLYWKLLAESHTTAILPQASDLEQTAIYQVESDHTLLVCKK